MKVLLHGWTHNSNFGDVLFTHLYFNRGCLESRIEKTDILDLPGAFRISPFIRDGLRYGKRVGMTRGLGYDLLVIMSGGCFSEARRSRKEAAKRFFRFLLPPILFILRGKPVVFLGIGGGPLNSAFMRMVTAWVLNRADRITARDSETADFLRAAGVRTTIQVTADTALTIVPEMLPEPDDRELLEFTEDSRTVMLQFSYSPQFDHGIATGIAPAIRRWAGQNGWRIVIATDKVTEESVLTRLESAKVLEGAYIYRYHDAWQMAAAVGLCDLVVTTTLHVGIIAAKLGRSVISLAGFHEKTSRFYRQIKEEGRCIPFRDADYDSVYGLLEKYAEKKIIIPETLVDLAWENLRIIQ